MMHAEAQAFFDYEVRGLYPEWEPNGKQADSWVKALKKVTPEIMNIALQQFYEMTAGDYKKPKLGKIMVLAQSQQQREGPAETKTKAGPEPLFTLKCVEHAKYKIGHLQRFYPPNPKQIPTEDSIIMKMAENTIKRIGGEWEIIRNWDTEEIPFRQKKMGQR